MKRGSNLFVIFVFILACSVFSSCGGGDGDNGGRLFSEAGYVEGDFAADPDLAMMVGDLAMFLLEPPSQVVQMGDTGQTGYDQFEFLIEETASLRLCWDLEEGQLAAEQAIIYNENGDELLVLTAQEQDCPVVELEPGRYIARLYHLDQNEETIPFFINLQEAQTTDASFSTGRAPFKDLEILYKKRKCPGCDFRSRNFRDSNLSGVNLRGAKLDYVTADRANFSQADLTSASMKMIGLTQANLENAKLGKCDLRYSKLQDANLNGADLTEADLSYANWTNGKKCKSGSIGKCNPSPY